MADPRLLLIAPPWRVPHLGSLALATLRPLCESAGLAVDELHGATLFPAADDGELDVDESWARYLFSAALRGCDLDAFVDEALRAILRDAGMNGILFPAERSTWGRLGVDEATVRRRFRRDLERAAACLDAIFERVMARDYDVVGFSLLFDDQVPAAATLARRIKQARPHVRTAFGGAACFEEQASGLLASFADVDAVCHTEGEDVIVPLVAALRGARPLAEVRGIAYRDDTGALHHNPSPPLLEELDRLPVPTYAAFLEQLAPTPWARLGARLLFETSRGCWWGQKSLCTFCGLNAEGLAYRSKSPERAFEEIRTLYETYPTGSYLQATDNILDMRFLTRVFPRLAPLASDPVRPLRLFYEVKSNMRLEDVEVMAAGGVSSVQPGIESFSDGVLKLMRKGNTALGQIQFLKWAQQCGIEPAYNVILCNPGDQAAWYREMAELLPALRHLPPPTSITPMLLERFSPYFLSPSEFGITNVRPKASYDVLYPAGVDSARLAYLFDYDHAMFADEELLAEYRSIAAALKRWIGEAKVGRAFYLDRGGRLDVVDLRDDDDAAPIAITGPAVDVFLYLDRHRHRAGIAEAFPALPADLVDCLLLTWEHRRWVVRSGDRWLAVLPRRGPARTNAKAARRRVPVSLPLAGAGG